MKRLLTGFTLIEVVIAFAIVALSVTTLYGMFGQSLRRESRAADESLALLYLASLRDRAGIDFPLREGVTDGAFDSGYQWRVSAQRTGAADTAPSDPTLLDITYTVSWQKEEHSFSVSSRSAEWTPGVSP